MNARTMKNMVLAVAAIALAAPVAQAQRRNIGVNPALFSGNTNSFVFGNGYTYQGINNFYETYYGASNYSFGNVYPFGTYGGVNIGGANGSVTVGGNGVVTPGYGSIAINSNGFNSYDQQGDLPLTPPVRLSDQIEVKKLSLNRVKIAWDGDPKPIAKMQFALLDIKKNVLKSQTITNTPAEATFVRPSTAAYYRVVITYGDGAMRSLISAL